MRAACPAAGGRGGSFISKKGRMSDRTLLVIPLGGLGEIGKNMMALEFGDDIIVIDAGVMFPDETMPPGIDFAIADFSYLIENRDKVRAILITHGHEDHIGALPYLLEKINAPVYASRLTQGLISVKLRERRLLNSARLEVVEPYSPFDIGKELSAEFFRVCHSIPDAMGIAVTTPLGVVAHTGDFKIDHTPADGIRTDFAELSRIVGDGALMLFSDSTYAEVEGYTPSERVVGDALDRAIGDAEGRVIVATFASLISRVQQVIDAAVRYGRKVAVVGRSMSNNVKMAMNMGYLDAPDSAMVSMSQARQLPPEELVVLATGSQGEPTSALARIANRRHNDIEIEPGDTVIISASPIPGNETVVAKTIDNLLRQGADVLYSRVSLVHVHGHAAREELKMMLSIVKPRFFVPVHGEYRHLMRHADIAADMGIPRSRIFVLEDGEVLAVDGEEAAVVGEVPAGHVFIDGRRVWDMDHSVLDDRRRLARDGVVTVTVTLSLRTGLPLSAPSITSVGFVDSDKSYALFENTSKRVSTSLEDLNDRAIPLESMKSRLTKTVADFIYGETRRRPTVLTVIEQV